MNILQVRGLSKIYGKGEVQVDALKDINFTVFKGEFIAVLGASGSGKSTLLNMIGALDTPTAGEVLINNQNPFSMEEEIQTIFRRRNIGFIFQSYNLIPELSVEENIVFPLLLDEKTPNPAHVNDVLEVLGIKDKRNNLPNQLSGGQQQRVAIGRALMNRPTIILADEPTGNLDTRSSNEVTSLLYATCKQFKQTVLMITHNENFASMADRVFYMEDGTLKDLGGNHR